MLYLKGLMGVQEYLKNSDIAEVEWRVFDLDWDISENKAKGKFKVRKELLESGDKAFRKMKKNKRANGFSLTCSAWTAVTPSGIAALWKNCWTLSR